MNTAILRRLTEAEGPFASVHFEDSHDTADAEKQLELRVRDVTAELADQGATEGTLEAIDQAIRASRPPVGKSGRSLIAAGESILLDTDLAEPPGEPSARYSALPYVLPLLRHYGAARTYLLVLVDQAGADLTVHDGHQELVAETVRGREHPVHKVRGGGAGDRNIQAHAEETVKQNMSEVADTVTRTAGNTGVGLIVVAGAVQARTALLEQLPAGLQGLTAELNSGSRADGSARENLEREIGELLAGRRLTVLDDASERFRAELGRESGLATGGIEGVVQALSEGNVETLLVGEPGNASVFTGTAPEQIAVRKNELTAFGVAEPVSRRADEALPYAAVATGADIVVLDERLDLAEGFGALLRHN